MKLYQLEVVCTLEIVVYKGDMKFSETPAWLFEILADKTDRLAIVHDKHGNKVLTANGVQVQAGDAITLVDGLDGETIKLYTLDKLRDADFYEYNPNLHTKGGYAKFD